jgi:small subunit ribosomal protein S19
MSRSIFKGPLINPFLKLEKNKKIKLFNKNLIILPEFLNHTFNVYSGKKFVLLDIKENMIGYKFGEFLSTRAKYKYKKK